MWDQPVYGLAPSTSPLGVIGTTDLPIIPAYGLIPGLPTPGWPTLLRPPIAINAFPVVQEY